MNSCIFFTPGTHFNETPFLSPEKKNVIFNLFLKSKKWSLLIFEIQFPLFFYVLLPIKKYHWSLLKIKMDNPGFEEDIQMTHQDDDYDD